MKKITFLIICITVSVFLYLKMNSQISQDSEFVDSNPSPKLVVDLKPKLKGGQLEESVPSIDSSTEIKYLKSDLATRFDNSDDLYALTLELHDLSIRGNIEAQFYLAKALVYCSSPEILSSEIDSALTLELHDWMRTRCNGFVNQDIEYLGRFEDWIELSAEGKYPQALVASLMMKEELPRTPETLKNLQLALSSKNSEVMDLIGGLGHPQKDKITNEAWRFLGCDYGQDCSAQSKDLWRLSLGASCTLQIRTGEECKTDIDYVTYSKSFYTSEEFEQIMIKTAFLKNIIVSDEINELTFEQILD